MASDLNAQQTAVALGLSETRYWEDQISDTAGRVVVDGEHYRIRPPMPDGLPGPGFGGQRFVIRFFNGREVTTCNLWHQGTIPAQFRGRLPDNAHFTA
jgi:hypothetical protein